MERIQKVLANCEQGLNTSEQAQARANIGAQAQLTAGQGIQINDNVISSTGSYTAGNGISIANNVVSVKTKTGGGLDVGADGVYVKGHYVSYDANQGLNTTNQTNARKNINAFEAPDMTNAAPWQVVRINENLKPTLGFAPEMYGGVYGDAIIIGGDNDTWKKSLPSR